MTAENAVVFENAAAHIGNKQIWHDTNFRVERGQFTAILGPNGAGKSTLLKAILGIQPATGGIEVLGQSAGKANRKIGYLPQRRSFDPSIPIRGVDIVRLGLDGNRWGIPIPFFSSLFARKDEHKRRELVDSAIESVGATKYARRPIGETSGGEQQRLLIAQALVRDPELLLLDEPLDSLDIPNQHSVAALIEDICKSKGITVMMVAHDINPILPYLDRVIYVAGGNVLSGAPEQVVRSETLTELYGSPIEVLSASDGRLVVFGAPDMHAHHHAAR